MAYVDSKARLVVHAVTAGAAVTSDPIIDVQEALPVPKERCVRVYYGGETEPHRMGGQRVLNAELVSEVTFIALFLPLAVSDEAIAATLDAQLYTFKHALRTAILGDSQLNGGSVDLELEYLEPDVVVIGNTRLPARALALRQRRDRIHDRAVTRVTSRVELDGNFFERDPRKTIRTNIGDMLDALAGELEAIVQGEIAGHAGSMPGYTGWSRDHIVGRTESYSGKHWALDLVVSANTAGMDARSAIRTKAAAATIERRWHPFRQAKSAVYRARATVHSQPDQGTGVTQWRSSPGSGPTCSSASVRPQRRHRRRRHDRRPAREPGGDRDRQAGDGARPHPARRRPRIHGLLERVGEPDRRCAQQHAHGRRPRDGRDPDDVRLVRGRGSGCQPQRQADQLRPDPRSGRLARRGLAHPANGYALEWGALLTTGQQTFATGTVNGASIDRHSIDFTTSTAFGASAYLHVICHGSGTATFTVQDSEDDSDWAAVTGMALPR